MNALTHLKYNHAYENEIRNLISDYKKNVDLFNNKIHNFVQEESSLNDYLSNVENYRSNRHTVLDSIDGDAFFRKKYSEDIKKYLNFYNRVTLKEMESLNNNKHVENSINVLHSNTDKLFNKLQRLKNNYNNDFENRTEEQFTVGNYRITLPTKERENNETNQRNTYHIIS